MVKNYIYIQNQVKNSGSAQVGALKPLLRV